MSMRKSKWASPKKGTPSKTRRRSLNRAPGLGVSRTLSSTSVKKPPSALAANIKVAVRVRPENAREQAGNFDNIINVVDKNMLVFDPKDCDDTFFFKGKQRTMRDLNKKQKKDKKFSFDNVYGEDSTNQEIFEGTTKSIVDTLFDGYNCCVFAYGATGAGKTHTMLGNQNNPGITYLTMKEIFTKKETVEDMNFEIFLSYIEVYNEGLRDLLEPAKNLIIREDGKSGTTISGMTMLKPTSPQEVLNLLSMGNDNRTQAPTDHNKESSRSHAILQIIVQQKPKDAGIKAEIKSAKLSMIDLAGSEKGTATGHKGDRFREGSNINKSLLALGNCINALAAGSKYIPYRDSKLTRLLKDSVGGNCATVMIANISPSSQTYEDTLNALKYADRAKQIKVDLKKNVHNVEFHVAQYAKIVENLKGEIETLKAKIKSLEDENEELKTSGGGSAGSASSIQVGSPYGISERLTAATSGQADIDMEDLDSLSMITKLRQQLSVLIERQKDYDQLQQRISDYVQSQKASEDEKSVLSKENAELKLQLSTLEKQCEELNRQKINDTDDALEELMLTREQTLEQIGYIRSLLSTLELRIHYKTLQAEKCNLIGIVNTEKEKSEFKMNRSIESLKRKMERKKVTLANLLTKFHVENKKIQEKIAQNPVSSTAIAAQARLSLEEHKTENILLHCVISSMEREFIRLNKDFLEAIPILVRDEKLLRGNGISTQEDKEKFTQLQAHVQSSVESVVFADNVKDPVPEEEYSVFKACCNLNLPSLYNTRRKSSNMEQKTVLLSDTMLEATQSETGLDETDSCGLGQNIHNNSTNVQNHSTNVQNHSTNVHDNSANVHQNSSSEQDMDFTVDATSTSELSDFSKEDLQHEAPVPLKARDSIYLSRTNVQNGTGLLSKQAVLAVHNKVAENTSMPQQSKTIPATSAELNSLSTNALPISSSFKATSPMASLSKKIKQDSLYLKSSTSSIKDKEVTAVNDLSSVKPIESFDSIFNRLKAKKENTNSEEIPPTPTLLKQSSGSQVQAPGVQPRNKSFLDRLPASTNNSPALTPDRRSSDIGVSSSTSVHLTSGPSDLTSSSDCMNETVTLEGSSIDDTVATLKGSKEEQAAGDKGSKEEQVAGDKDKKRPLPIDLTTDSFESPGKKGKTLNETYCQPEDVPSAWLSHRGGSAIPDSPLITATLPRSPLVTATPDSPLVIGELAQSPSIVDSTFTKGSMSPSPLSLGAGKGDSSLTDVIGTDNLLAQLGAKCAIQSEPVQTRAEPVLTEKEPVSTSANQNVKSDNLNSTFPVEELENEAMDVDPSSNILDISVIPPPKKSPNQLLSIRNKSPVRAKMGYSPTLAHRKHNPSPLRESTLLDLKKEGGHANSSGQVTKPSGHQPLASSGHQPTASSGHQPTASSGHQPTASSGQMAAPVSSSIKGQQSGLQSIIKSGNKPKMLTTGSTKGKRTLTSSRSMSALLKPAAAHKLNLPTHPNRSRSPGDPLRATTVTSPTPPSYARTTQASSNKMSTLDRKNKGLENQRPAGGAITIKSTGLKRSNSSAAVRPKQI